MAPLRYQSVDCTKARSLRKIGSGFPFSRGPGLLRQALMLLTVLLDPLLNPLRMAALILDCLDYFRRRRALAVIGVAPPAPPQFEWQSEPLLALEITPQHLLGDLTRNIHMVQ
jgi:hypothetical protein